MRRTTALQSAPCSRSRAPAAFGCELAVAQDDFLSPPFLPLKAQRCLPSRCDASSESGLLRLSREVVPGWAWAGRGPTGHRKRMRPLVLPQCFAGGQLYLAAARAGQRRPKSSGM
jgi:hypothetical protein